MKPEPTTLALEHVEILLEDLFLEELEEEPVTTRTPLSMPREEEPLLLTRRRQTRHGSRSLAILGLALLAAGVGVAAFARLAIARRRREAAWARVFRPLLRTIQGGIARVRAAG
jgi:hypothetical protein